MLHLIIPTRNEAPYIKDAIRRLSKSLSDLTIPWQITVADNGSSDGTQLAVNELRISNNELNDKVSVIECPIVGRVSKGAAITHVATALDQNHEHVFGFIDADLSADPDAIPAMVNRILEDKADIVIASRLLVTKTTNRSWIRTLSSKAFNLLADLMLHLNVEDAQCGLKIMNKKGLDIIKSCQEKGWFLDIEFLARARQDKLRIVEIPVPWIEFRYPERKSQIRHLKDGFGAFRAILRIKHQINGGKS
jgi:glycosyltransferase involved in cell wall biosynthesis